MVAIMGLTFSFSPRLLDYISIFQTTLFMVTQNSMLKLDQVFLYKRNADRIYFRTLLGLPVNVLIDSCSLIQMIRRNISRSTDRRMATHLVTHFVWPHQ